MPERVAPGSKKKAPSDITLRIKALAKSKKLSARGLARKAKIPEVTVVQAFTRGSAFTSENLRKVVAALELTMEQVVGASAMELEMEFQQLVRWAHETSSISRMMTLHPDVTVGDLLRYRASPSSQGELDAEEVWSLIERLRKGPVDVSTGRDVTPEEEASVLSGIPKR